MPSALLIDLDGTLIDSEPWYKRTEVATLNGFGVPIKLEEMGEFTGLTLRTWLQRINSQYDKALTMEQFLEDYRPQMEEHVRTNVQMFSDTMPFLERAKGVPSILVTSSMKWYVDVVLERFPEIGEAVQGVVCEADVKIGKPDPEPYLMASERLGVDPGLAWVIEDAKNGVTSGIAAGCHVIGVDREGHGTLGMAHQVVSDLSGLLVRA